DCLALCVSHPEIARRHILRTAARQFPEGDVQHWWLPETGKGVRTTISDDRAWLAYVVSHYVDVTGDTTILDEQVPFLDGQRLKPGEHEAFFQPQPTSETATLYEHCARGLDLCLPVGAHGLPLMGSGDWNDGMNRVGENGKGESVWLGWFVYDVLTKFIPVAEARSDGKRTATWLLHITVLKDALEDNGWDGDWYRRAYYDDGTPLGSVANAECRIDSIAQSWSVLSGAAEPARAARAMQAVDKYLVRGGDQLTCCSRLPSSIRSTIRDTSKAIRRACARMAANTPTECCGRSRPLPNSAWATGQGNCSPCSTPSTIRAAAPPPSVIASNPMSPAATSIPCRRMSAAVAGRGIPAPRAGCIASASNGFWACTSKPESWCSIPASRPIGRVSRRRCATRARPSKSWSKTPSACAKASPNSPSMMCLSKERPSFCRKTVAPTRSAP